MLLAAGERHACGVDDGGVVGCWGEAAAVAAASPPRISRAVSTVAVGDAVTCVLWGNWTVSCWPEGEASPPPALAGQQFVALEAKGKVVCGVLMSDYSLQCWGAGVAGGVRKVFDKVLPGPCAPSKSCSCGVWSGSAQLCAGSGGGGGGDVSVCYPCGYTPPPMALSPTSNSSSSSSSQSKGKRRPSNLAIALISAGAGSALVALLAALAAVYYLRRHRGSSSPVSGRIHAEPTGTAPRVERRLSALLSKGPNTTVEQFPLVALRAATDCFSPAKRIGSGSFGAVYRASLPDGREVAIKRAERRDTGGPSSSSAAAARRVDHEAAFVSELALLSRVNHKNLDHLHRRAASAAAPVSPPVASWPSRLRLALGAARGIEYMHTYAVPPIIHRDIKSSNILLDSCWTAKVSDFGLSLLNTLDGDNAAAGDGGNAGDGDDEERCVTAGTVGYMDPEYYRLQHLTDKSDVYSFGVVLLELLSGCKAIQKYEGSGSPKNVVDMAVPHIEGDRVHRVLDARLPLPTPWEMEAVAYVGYLAADCVRLAGRDRPTMSEVVGVLERAVAACDEYEEGGAGAGGEPALSRSCTDGSTATGEVRCYGGGEVVGREPAGRRFMLLAAGERHACGVDDGGVVGCWGEAAAVAAASPPRISRAVSTVAVGDAVTCVLWGNWTVSCWPEGEASPPPALAGQQFVALEAKGKVVCGVLMSDYSLQCWGAGVAGGVRKVFDKVLPGPCAPSKSCSCGVWSGSAQLCAGSGGGGGGDVSVCYPCGYTPPPMALSPTSNSSSSSSSQSKGKRRPSNLAIALISAGAGSALVALLAALAAVYYLRRHRGSSSPVSGRIHAEPTGTAPRVERRLSALLSKGPNTTVEQFPLVALRAATDCFSPAKRIGSGSFGAVYRASLPDGREVAIKRAERRDTGGPSSSSAAAARRVDHEAAFVSELALLSRVNHKNLDHLHRRAASAAAPVSPPVASWPSRLRLALGAARGIEYMHTYAVPPIIHRDIKSSNILLDSCWTAKVSDFGLSLLNTLDGDNAAAGDGGNAGDGDDEERCVTAGTVGYMDPEYYRLQHLTDKSDVYSFGVVLLELLSGCKAIQKYEGSGSPKNVVDMAVPHIEGDRVHRVLDARLPLPTPWEMEAVAYVGYLAADCVRLAGRDRPTMSEVVGVLERAVAACDEYEEGGAGAGGEPALSRSCTDGSTAT
ncbi:hypothetical protein OsJ_14911 [Oryza sativa Japonica Group]|uniref:Protein kinase domain-containing protein n=1 Tax=Oryza sativa subsp. japonica TaxID=39947 RepID=B9FFC0_ORYSJ|nr:hypothetical protein OsJ_14911 [Oryza sativa Japonica Group]